MRSLLRGEELARREGRSGLLQQTAIVIPLAVEVAVTGCFNEMLEHGGIGVGVTVFEEGNIVGADALIERRELAETRPYMVLFHGGFDVGVDFETARSHGRQHLPAGIGHQPQPFQPADPLFVQLGPGTLFLAGCETLHANTVHKCGHAVNPSETKGLFHRVEIPEVFVVGGAAAFHYHPTFRLAGVVG